MSGISLNLLVIRTADIERSRRFYDALGLRFTKEKHGNGPEHYACEMSTLVFEIYPRGESSESVDSLRLGFRVPSVDAVFDSFEKAGAEVLLCPTDSQWGRRAVVLDP